MVALSGLIIHTFSSLTMAEHIVYDSVGTGQTCPLDWPPHTLLPCVQQWQRHCSSPDRINQEHKGTLFLCLAHDWTTVDQIGTYRLRRQDRRRFYKTTQRQRSYDRLGFVDKLDIRHSYDLSALALRPGGVWWDWWQPCRASGLSRSIISTINSHTLSYPYMLSRVDEALIITRLLRSMHKMKLIIMAFGWASFWIAS